MEERTPPVQFEDNLPVTGTFKFDEPLSGDGKYGKWFLYKFDDVKGNEQIFFTKETLATEISRHEPLKGKSFSIIRQIAKDENGNIKHNAKGFPIKTYSVTITEDAGKPTETPPSTTPPTEPISETEMNAKDVGFFDESGVNNL